MQTEETEELIRPDKEEVALRTELALIKKELEDTKLDGLVYKSLAEKLGYALLFALGCFAILWLLIK